MKKLIKITVWTLAFTVTLVVLFYAEENWRGARAWLKTTAELQAQGYPLTISEIIPPPVADDDNIAAAPIFAELFNADGDSNQKARLVTTEPIQLSSKNKRPNLAKGESGDLRLSIDQPDEPLTVRQTARELLSQLDQEWTPLLAEVHAALQRPQCRWQRAYESGFEGPFPYLTPSLNLVKIYQLRAWCYLETGETQKAAADLDDAFKLAQAVESHPFLIDCLVAVTERNMALPVFWSGIINHQWRDEDLARLQQTFAAHNGFEKLKQAFINDHAGAQSMDFRNKKKIFGQPSNESSTIIDQLETLIFQTQPYGRILINKSLMAQCTQNSVNAINAEELTVSVELCERNEAYVAGFNNFTQFIAKSAAAGLANIAKKMAQMETSRNQAILSCALERYRLRHGKLPLTLSELAPEFIEKIPNQVTVSDPMIYRRVSDSDYVLYSIGWNLRDDGGTISDDRRADQLDWVWVSKPELYQRKKIAE